MNIFKKIKNVFSKPSQEKQDIEGEGILNFLSMIWEMLQVSAMTSTRQQLLIEHPMVWMMYVFGIMDYLSQKHNLTESKTIAIFSAFLYGKVEHLTETKAASTGIAVREVMECSATEYGQELMKLGVQEFHTFLYGSDNRPFKGLYTILESIE